MEKLVPFNPSLVPRRRVPPLQSHREIMSEENTIDPDDGNSWICSACTLPIFSTPFKISYQKSKENAKLLLHDQCASLPEKLMDHPLHPRQALHLVKNDDSSASTISCKKCREKCGTMFYKCIDSFCSLQLDLLCSLPMIKILHRSHEHRLMVIRGSASFICGACGTQHQGLSAPSYFCSACNFWIHRDCASLPNAIKLLHPKHQHSLFLTYDRSTSSSAFSSSSSSKCAICGDVLHSLGAYLCVKCGYYIHIRCATSDPQCFQPVLIRDAKLADLLHLPMADERANLVQYMLENTSAARDDEDEERGGDDDDDDGCRHDPKLKKHSLIFHDEDVSDDDDDDGTGHSSHVCTEVEVEAEVEVEEEGGGGGDDNDGCKHDPKLYKHSLIYHDEYKDVSDDDDDDDDDGTGHSSRACTEVEVEAEVEVEEEGGGGGADDDDGCKHDPKLYKHSLIYHDEDKDDEDEARGGGGGDDDDDDDDDDGCRHNPELKKHSLIFHDEDEDVSDDDDDDGPWYSSGVCNACVQFISPPFYSCSKCRDFLLHSCCADLPRKIHHPIHPEHTLFLFSETPVSRLERPGFTCTGCLCLCSGFGYSCETCGFIKLDVVCALMPPSITHESHGKTHILHMSRNFYSAYKCSCCMLELNRIFYECSNCRQLKLHGRCALLPTTLTHKFDRHPLKLTTSTKISLLTSTGDSDGDDSDADHSEAEMQHICDVCEKDIEKKCWYYSCKQLDNSFHINCIPFFNLFYKVKYGVSVDVNFHDCPLTLVPEATLSGYHCDVCRGKFMYMHSDAYLKMYCAYECTKCNYRVHGVCATESSELKKQ